MNASCCVNYINLLIKTVTTRFNEITLLLEHTNVISLNRCVVTVLIKRFIIRVPYRSLLIVWGMFHIFDVSGTGAVSIIRCEVGKKSYPAEPLRKSDVVPITRSSV
jgi:hypothetical protein